MKIYRAITTILTIVGLTLALSSGAQAEEGFYVAGNHGLQPTPPMPCLRSLRRAAVKASPRP